jgi:hypothetical protein
MADGIPNPDAPTETADAAADRRHNIAELVAAILLGVAGVLTAFSAYQAALTDGDALQGYTESTQLLANSNQFYAQAVQQNTSDRDLFTQFAIASTSGNLDVADYIAATLMDDNLRGAVEWWVEASETDDAALSPFADHPDNPYVNTNQAEAVALEEQSVAKQAEGSKADEDGDQFELAAVLFALTLFFGGISTLLHRELATWILLGAAAVSSVVGIIVLVPVL